MVRIATKHFHLAMDYVSQDLLLVWCIWSMFELYLKEVIGLQVLDIDQFRRLAHSYWLILIDLDLVCTFKDDFLVLRVLEHGVV